VLSVETLSNFTNEEIVMKKSDGLLEMFCLLLTINLTGVFMLRGMSMTQDVSPEMVGCIKIAIFLLFLLHIAVVWNVLTLKTAPPYLSKRGIRKNKGVGTYWWLQGKETSGRRAPPSVMTDRNLFLDNDYRPVSDDAGAEVPKQKFFPADGSVPPS
jgi:hypothetical protein